MEPMRTLLSSIIAAIAGLWIAAVLVPGVTITGNWQTYLLLGAILGGLMWILARGFFKLIIGGVLIFAMDYFSRQFSAPLWWPLVLTTLIVWLLNIIISNILSNHE